MIILSIIFFPEVGHPSLCIKVMYMASFINLFSVQYPSTRQFMHHIFFNKKYILISRRYQLHLGLIWQQSLLKNKVF
jgi:hypothetical protein